MSDDTPQTEGAAAPDDSPPAETAASRQPERAREYWQATLRLTISLLVVWFLVSFGCGILFREALDAYSIGGAPLGFWFAQNGAIYVFLLLIVIYCFKMTEYEKKFGIER